MKNLFELAKFSNRFITRDGRIVLFGHRMFFGAYILYAEDKTIICDNNGMVLSDGEETNDDIIGKWEEPMDLFKQLPHLNGEFEIVEDWGYTPSLYHFDSQWFVSWVHCEDGDTILDYFGDTPEEAIINAYKNYKKDIEKRKSKDE